MFRTVFYRRRDGKWDFRVVAGNHRTVLNSDQGYENKGDAIEIANKVLDSQVARAFTVDTSAWDAAADERHQLSDKGGNDT